MARVRFLGDSVTCSWLGVDFVRGEWVEKPALDAGQLARMDAHPHFEVSQTPAELAAAAKADAKAAKAADAAEAEAAAEAAKADAAP